MKIYFFKLIQNIFLPMVKNTPNYLNIRLQYQFISASQIFWRSSQMEYQKILQQYHEQYSVNGTLLNHCRMTQSRRARLFTWISDACSNQQLSRYCYVLTCQYIDLYFMKRNKVNSKDLQLFALGALVLASKNVQTSGKLPEINNQVFPHKQILKWQKIVASGLNFYLNPPNYIQILNNMAKIWDIKCETEQIKSTVRYFKENKESYYRLKTLFQKIDCLYLFKKILNFDIRDVVVTFFYTQTKMFHLDKQMQEQVPLHQTIFWNDNQHQKDQFQLNFQRFLSLNQIERKPIVKIQKMILLLTNQNYPINQQIQVKGRTYCEFASKHTHNVQGFIFYQRYREAIQRI